MRYFGGKQRIAGSLAYYMNQLIKQHGHEAFVDLFCGSCNILTNIKCNTRVGNDIHPSLIAMWQAVQAGWIPPDKVSREEYNVQKAKKEVSPLDAFIGFGCSFGGKYWGGYANSDNFRNYASNAKNSTLQKLSYLQDVTFINLPYSEVILTVNSLIYCDIPYKDTKEYAGTPRFDHAAFYTWLKANTDKDIIVSEYDYNVPAGAKVIHSIRSKQDMNSSNGKIATQEVLFTFSTNLQEM